jgi:hypothetical protein
MDVKHEIQKMLGDTIQLEKHVARTIHCSIPNYMITLHAQYI